MSDEVRDTLLKAADVIHEYGWRQGTYGDETGVCAVGAMRVAIRNFPVVAYGQLTQHERRVHDAATDALYDVIKPEAEFLPGYTGANAITIWNDRAARDADDVVHALKRAAEEL
jgi:hypothetical protein